MCNFFYKIVFKESTFNWRGSKLLFTPRSSRSESEKDQRTNKKFKELTTNINENVDVNKP